MKKEGSGEENYVEKNGNDKENAGGKDGCLRMNRAKILYNDYSIPGLN